MASLMIQLKTIRDEFLYRPKQIDQKDSVEHLFPPHNWGRKKYQTYFKQEYHSLRKQNQISKESSNAGRRNLHNFDVYLSRN